MKLNKYKLKDLITSVSEKNKQGLYSEVLGVAIEKEFMPSVANLNGTDLTKYSVVRKNRFAFNPMHVGRDKKLPIAMYRKDVPALVSPAYEMFEVNDEQVNLEYLMLYFKNPSFDHLCWFYTDGSVRGGLSWSDFCDIEIELPSIEEQEKIVRQYKTIENRINTLNKIVSNFTELCLNDFKNKCKNKEKNGFLSDLYTFQYGKGNNIPKDNGGRYPVYGSNGIVSHVDYYNNEDEPIIGHIGSCGSLVFAYGKHYVTYNGIMCNIIDKGKKYCGYLTLLNENLQKQTRGSTQPFISYDMLNEIPVVLFDEKDYSEMEKKYASVFENIRKYKKEIEILNVLRANVFNCLI